MACSGDPPLAGLLVGKDVACEGSGAGCRETSPAWALVTEEPRASAPGASRTPSRTECPTQTNLQRGFTPTRVPSHTMGPGH